MTDYISYFSAFEKVKEILINNSDKFYSANYLYDEVNLKKLKLLIVLLDPDYEKSIDVLLSKNRFPLEIKFVTISELCSYLSKKNPQELLNELVELWYVAGSSISRRYYDALIETNKGDLQYLRQNKQIKETLKKGFPYWLMNGAGVLLYNQGLKKFLVLGQQIDNGIYWNIPKGGIRPGERIFETIKRELFEETKITKYNLKNKSFVTMHNYTKNNEFRKAYNVFFAATTGERKITLSDEHVEYTWLSFEDLLAQAKLPSQKWAYYKLGKYLLSQ